MRIIRLLLGMAIIIQGIYTAQWMFVILGSLFSLMPLLNIGCCSNNNCNTHMPSKQKHQPTENIPYEEVS